MISLHIIPFRVDDSEYLDYIRGCDISVLPSQLRAIDKGMTYIRLYRGTVKIGVVLGYIIDDMWYAHRVHLYKKYYFKQVIDKISDFAKSLGCVGIVIAPDERTRLIYDKHNIAKRI